MPPASPGALRMANGYPQAPARDGRGWARPHPVWHDASVTPRFLTLADVAETLNISASQAYALVRSGDLPAIKIGGRGQWRVEDAALESFIVQQYEQTREFVRTHPFGDTGADEPDSR